MNDEIFNKNGAQEAPEAVKQADETAENGKPEENITEKKNKKEKKPKKKKKKWLIVLLCLLTPVLLVLGIVGGVYFSLMASYNKNSYVEVPIVERTSPYVEPPTESQAPVWEEAEPPKEEDIGRDFVEPGKPVAVPNNESGGGGSSYQGDNYDRNASFGRNENARSVYGKTPIYKVAKKNPDVENILIIGTDSRDVTRERGRSDALIVLSHNKKTNEIKMISILRDSLVPIEGHGWSRINHAYSWDGVGLCVNTVNELFDLDIQRFVVVDFNGVTDFVDKIGGIDMNLTQKEANYINNYSSGTLNLKAGMNHLNGDRALVYMRIRKIDSDFKRTERQRKVIEAVAKKIVAEKNISEIYDLTEFAFGLIKTNITFTELTGTVANIATAALASGNIDIQTQHVPYSDAYKYKYYNGMAIVSFNINDAARRMNKFIYG